MQYQSRTGPITNNAAAFGPEMVQGYQPSRGGHRHVRQLGWSTSQTTHVAAPQNIEMVEGSVPDRNRERLPLRRGHTWWPPDVPAFDVAMTQGYHPDEPRLFLGPRIPLPSSTQTQIVAPFSPEMAEGYQPERNREQFPTRRLGWTVTQHTPVAAPFGPEMVQGWKPTSPARQDLRLHVGLVAQVAEVAAFSIEMVRGSIPPSPRIRLGPKIPLPVSQTTHVAATFGPEMVEGYQPERFRQQLPVRTGWLASELRVEAALNQWYGQYPATLPRIVGLHASMVSTTAVLHPQPIPPPAAIDWCPSAIVVVEPQPFIVSSGMTPNSAG